MIVYEPTEVSSDKFMLRIHDALSSPIAVTDSVLVSCTASVGYADTRTVGRAPATLLAAADRAMYEAKRARSRLHFHETPVEGRADDHGAANE